MNYGSVSKKPLQMNPQMNLATNYMVDKMKPNSNSHSVDILTPDEISYMQAYLEQVKVNKLKQLNMTPNTNTNMNPIINRTFDIGPNVLQQQQYIDADHFSTYTRLGKKSSADYYNPYEYGAKQNQLPPNIKVPHVGTFSSRESAEPNKIAAFNLGIEDSLYYENFPGRVRNVNVESSLLQKEMTHGHGQRATTSLEANRFEQLPFNPQDTRHIVWDDEMPRGGYSTRNDRLTLS